MSDGTCVIGQREHAAHVGYVCDHHLQKLRDTMREVEFEAEHLSAIPSMAQRTGGGHGSLASQRANGRLNVVAMNDKRTSPHGPRPAGPACHSCWHDTCMVIRRWQDAYDAQATEIMSILGTLHGWGRIVREERPMTGPEHITVSGERDFLDRQLMWCAEQSWISEMYDDMRKLLAQIQGANSTGPDKPYSYCPVITRGEPCHGQVWVHDELQPVWRRYSDRCAATWENAPGAAVCDTCGAAWATPADKARLRRMIDDAASELVRPHTADDQPMQTASEIAAEHDVKVGTIAVWAHRRGIVSVGGYYDPRAFRERMTG